MAYSYKIAHRIRESLGELIPLHLPGAEVEEKEMMGGIAFMVNEKMCVGVIKDELMARIDPEIYEEALEKSGCREMDFTKRPMKGFILVDDDGLKSKKEFEYWIRLALEYNPKAKKSKKKKK